jgi:hypothetical protein
MMKMATDETWHAAKGYWVNPRYIPFREMNNWSAKDMEYAIQGKFIIKASSEKDALMKLSQYIGYEALESGAGLKAIVESEYTIEVKDENPTD